MCVCMSVSVFVVGIMWILNQCICAVILSISRSEVCVCVRGRGIISDIESVNLRSDFVYIKI